MRIALAAAVAVALLAVSSAGSATRPASPALITLGLTRAVAAGRLTPDEAAGYRAEVARAQVEARRLPPLRAKVLKGVLADVAALRRSYTRPRALTLFSTLAVNTESIANSWVTLPPPLSSNLGASIKLAFSPSPQLAPVDARVKFSSARAGPDNPSSASATEAAPHPRAVWNWRLLIPFVIIASPRAEPRAAIVAQTGRGFQPRRHAALLGAVLIRGTVS